MPTFLTKRVYDDPEAGDGIRVLVDRLWPRGLTKDAAAVDHWMKQLAPSDALRKWFDHDPEKWDEFRKRYTKELDQQPDCIDWLRGLTATGPVTIVFGAKDVEHSNAAALVEYLATKG